MATWKVITRDGQRGIVLPDVVREDLDRDPTAAFGSVVEDGEWKSVPKDRFVPFAKPGGRLEAKRMYTIKAHSPDGVLRQIPLEGQINNHTASPDTGLGLQLYIRRGYVVYWDPADHSTAFCPTWGCFAEANKKFNNFCTPEHKEISQPEQDRQGFSLNPTTTSSSMR